VLAVHRYAGWLEEVSKEVSVTEDAE